MASVERQQWHQVHQPDEHIDESKEGDLSSNLLQLTKADKNVAKVMRLMTYEMDWINLYRIYEVIRDDIGSQRVLIERGWCKKFQVNAFTGSANNSSVSGDLSRHGRTDSPIPSKIMELREGRNFVSR